jgi:hypothetical protein
VYCVIRNFAVYRCSRRLTTTTTESIGPDGVGWRCILIVLDGIVILTIGEVIFLPVLLIFFWEVGIIVNVVVVVDNGSRIPPMALLAVDTTGFDLAPRSYAQRIRLLPRTTATKQRIEVKVR